METPGAFPHVKEWTFASSPSDEAHQGEQSGCCCMVFSLVWKAVGETNPLAANRVGACEALCPRPQLSEVARLFAVCVLLSPSMKRESGLVGTFFFLNKTWSFKAPRNVAHRIFLNKRNSGAHFNGSIPLYVRIRCCWCTELNATIIIQSVLIVSQISGKLLPFCRRILFLIICYDHTTKISALTEILFCPTFDIPFFSFSKCNIYIITYDSCFLTL